MWCEELEILGIAFQSEILTSAVMAFQSWSISEIGAIWILPPGAVVEVQATVSRVQNPLLLAVIRREGCSNVHAHFMGESILIIEVHIL